MGGSDEFGEIAERTGFKEHDVIEVMRRELKPSSFRLWRKRVSGRITKYRRLLERTLKGPKSPTCDDCRSEAEYPAFGLRNDAFGRCQRRPKGVAQTPREFALTHPARNAVGVVLVAVPSFIRESATP